MPFHRNMRVLERVRNMFYSLVLLIVLVLGQQCNSQDSTYDGGHRGHDRFHGADHYDFALLLSGKESQCYWHFAHQTGRFYLSYMVQWVSGMIADTHVAVSILSPKGILISFSDDPLSQMGFQVKETGFYQMCFANYHNRFGDMRVFLNFGVYYDGADEFKMLREIEEGILNSTVSSIESITNKIKVRIQHMWRFYNIARMRKGRDYFLLQAKSNYVNTWSCLQSFTIIMAGYLQLCLLKTLFRTQKDHSRPRC